MWILVGLLGAVTPASAQLAARPPGRSRPAPRPDIVLVIADDVGWDDLVAVAAAGHAPNLVALASQGFRFTNFRAAPVCSPSRRALYTGDFFADQSGLVCGPPDGREPPQTTLMLPQALPSYVSALVGKWHVGPHPTHPNWRETPRAWGFAYWRAGLPWYISGCLGTDYYQWRRIEDGYDLGIDFSYQPAVMGAAFQTVWSETASGPPRLVVFSTQLAHSTHGQSHRYHRPPDALLPGGAAYPPTPTRRDRFEAMIAALDTQVGEIAARLDFAEDVLVFVSDNGTPKEVAPAPERAKTTTFERGVRVPAFIVGAGIRPGQSRALVSIADVYATLCELAGEVPPVGIDSRSVMPLVHGRASRIHDYIAYGIRGDPQFGHDDLAVSSLRYKYRRWRARDQDGSTGPWVEEFYDLLADPAESTNRIADPALGPKVVAHAAFLDAELP